jgi:hypothetical protein
LGDATVAADKLTDATAANRRSNALGSFLDGQTKHGEITPEELASATKELTRPPKKVGAIDSDAAALHASPAGWRQTSISPIWSVTVHHGVRRHDTSGMPPFTHPCEKVRKAEFSSSHRKPANDPSAVVLLPCITVQR